MFYVLLVTGGLILAILALEIALNDTGWTYKARYYWRKLVYGLGFCPDCFNKVNHTSSGRPICPHCKK